MSVPNGPPDCLPGFDEDPLVEAAALVPGPRQGTLAVEC
jgi:hypothetical protein